MVAPRASELILAVSLAVEQHVTVDEMAHAWVNVTNISDEDYKEWASKHGSSQPTVAAAAAAAGAPDGN